MRSTTNNFIKKSLSLLTILVLIAFTNSNSQTITPLDSLKTNDSDGVSMWAQAPSINVTGVVTSTIECGTGTAGPGTIQNAHTGIAVYGNFFASQGGVKIGDSVIVNDVKVNPYNGLTELSYNATSTVQIVSSNRPVTPVVITLGQISQGWNGFEKYESMFVKVHNVTFTDTAKTFSLNTKTAWSYHITDGKDTVQFRITKNTPDLIGTAIPKTPVDVSGIASQYDSSAPYNSGYEIFPLGASSIGPVTAVENEPKIELTYSLSQNYPNPFNPTTTITFSVPSSQKVDLAVYDLLGRRIQTLYDAVAPAGMSSVKFDGSKLSSGVYFYTIRTSNVTLSKKLVLMK